LRFSCGLKPAAAQMNLFLWLRARQLQALGWAALPARERGPSGLEDEFVEATPKPTTASCGGQAAKERDSQKESAAPRLTGRLGRG
jgi:hypothetical protein